MLRVFPAAGGWEGGKNVKVSGRGLFATPLIRCRWTLLTDDGSEQAPRAACLCAIPSL